MKIKISDRIKALFTSGNKNLLQYVIKVLSTVGAMFCLSYLAIYLLQDGYANIKERVFFDNVFYDMWVRLINFDVTINPKIIGPEAFLVNGKTIAYFLPLPALVRGILSLFNYGSYSVVSMLIAFMLFAISSRLIFSLILENILPKDRTNRVIKVGWLILLAFGSPFLSILVNSSTYWEAIAWGTAMFMVCLYSSMDILLKPKDFIKLLLFGFFCGLTLFTKPTSGIGVSILFLLTILMLFVNTLKSDNWKASPKIGVYHIYELVSVCTIFCVFGTSLCVLNFARWGNPFEFAPLAKHTMFIGNERGKNIEKYGTFRLDRVPENISYYLLPSKDNFSFESPFIQVGHSNYFCGVAENFDYREPTFPIPVILPVFSLLALLGCAFYIKNFFSSFTKHENSIWYSSLLPTAVSAFIPGIVLLPFNAQAIRYGAEFIPGIVLFSIYGIAIFLKSSNSINFQKQHKRRLVTVLNLLVIGILLSVSLYTTTAGLLTERQIFPGFSTSSSRLDQSKIVTSFPLLFSKVSLPMPNSLLATYFQYGPCNASK